jgi:hypothetical protein
MRKRLTVTIEVGVGTMQRYRDKIKKVKAYCNEHNLKLDISDGKATSIFSAKVEITVEGNGNAVDYVSENFF